ncbi:ABC transporter ATP-binding protein [Reichenbachiella agarivorans]|uniref:ABC transporter ATP-binding protein n=1 Tax=Reichenbachiella agarivorans TaxID=2979464 RepID=A0ABY6CQQ0_9BACT|nr:ABC transporter ATP-binding protein [Reichenbachiella agarivorans]UXP32144.1 ABC transporter ATP-binding protein [Reichenbachiella agarivorans]
MKALSTAHLSIGYGEKIIASEVSLALQPGQLICLLGQNGVGKSTLLRTLSGTQTPLSGEVMIGEEKLSNMDRKDLAKQIGIITTDKIGMSNMSVRELVALGRFPYTNWIGKESTEDKRKIQESIDLCKINYIEHAKLGTLSDGQFQKAMVARALAQDTDFILMDEPTAHLDIVNRIDMFGLFAAIKSKTQKAILVSTHELDLSLQFADQLWLMDFNSAIVSGDPASLIQSGAITKIFHHEEYEIDLSNAKSMIRRKK